MSCMNEAIMSVAMIVIEAVTSILRMNSFAPECRWFMKVIRSCILVWFFIAFSILDIYFFVFLCACPIFLASFPIQSVLRFKCVGDVHFSPCLFLTLYYVDPQLSCLLATTIVGVVIGRAMTLSALSKFKSNSSAACFSISHMIL